MIKFCPNCKHELIYAGFVGDIEKTCLSGAIVLQPELSDVLEAIDLGKDHVVEDWPWGRKQRCTMHFYVGVDPKRGERFVKQSTMNGRTFKPKKATYATAIKIVMIGDRIGHVTWHKDYGHFGIDIEDSKYASRTFFDTEAEQLAKRFGFIV